MLEARCSLCDDCIKFSSLTRHLPLGRVVRVARRRPRLAGRPALVYSMRSLLSQRITQMKVVSALVFAAALVSFDVQVFASASRATTVFMYSQVLNVAAKKRECRPLTKKQQLRLYNSKIKTACARNLRLCTDARAKAKLKSEIASTCSLLPFCCYLGTCSDPSICNPTQ